jgi:hypothetical protein
MNGELGIHVSALNTLISNEDTTFKQSISKQLDWQQMKTAKYEEA